MSIVLPITGSSGGGSPPDFGVTDCLNYLAWRNKLQEADTVLSLAPGGEGEGSHLDSFDWKPYTAWKPLGTDCEIEFFFPVPVSMDYFAAAYYAIGTGSMFLDRYSVGAYVNVQTVDGALTGDKPFFKKFTSASSDRWRVRVEDASVPIVLGVVAAGEWLGIPMQEIGWTPPRLARDTKILTSKAEGGMFLGRSIIRAASRFEITANFLRVDWAYDAWFEFIKHAELNPFFFYWDIGAASDTAFCWVDEEIKGATFVGTFNVDAVLPVRGFVG